MELNLPTLPALERLRRLGERGRRSRRGPRADITTSTALRFPHDLDYYSRNSYKANHVASNNVHYGSMELSGVPRRDLLNEVGRRIRRRIGIVVGRSPSS